MSSIDPSSITPNAESMSDWVRKVLVTGSVPSADTHAHTDPDYDNFLAAIKLHFAHETKDLPKLFTVDTAGMWDLYLGSLPMAERQHHNCNSCKQFVERFGGLVTINDKGETVSAIWPNEGNPNVPTLYTLATGRLNQAASQAPITGVFFNESMVLGKPMTGTWTHFSVKVMPALRATVTDPDGKRAEKAEERRILGEALGEYSAADVLKAVEYLSSGQLYRSEKGLPHAQWLADIYSKLSKVSNSPVRQRRSNAIIWKAVATAPAGFCHVKSSVLGTLLDDIQQNAFFGAIKAHWDSKLDPTAYQRPTAVPADANVAKAEKIVADLRAAGALRRRFATRDDITESLWEKAKWVREPRVCGVFQNVATRSRTVETVPGTVLPEQTITWAKFQRTVLPTARKIEVQMPATEARLMGLIAPVDPKSPRILQWANGVSWFYAGGIDGEMKRRVEQAGGKYEDRALRATLMWNDRTDLDLHCHTNDGDHIYYAAKRAFHSGGYLDVDKNVHGETETPVENIQWPKGTCPTGVYRFSVHNFTNRTKYGPTRFELEISVNGETRRYSGLVPARAMSQEYTVAFNAERRVAIFNNTPGAEAAPATWTDWGVLPGRKYEVTQICQSPNMWGADPQPRHGQHIFFLIDGCSNTRRGVAKPFFVETLRSEFHEVRSTLAAYADTAEIEETETANAFGLGFNPDSPWDLVVLVTTEHGTQAIYKIDRWD